MATKLSVADLKTAFDAVAGGVENVPPRFAGNMKANLLLRSVLKVAFDKVAPKDDWKGPIDAPLDVGLDEFEPEVYVKAIEFFAGAPAEIVKRGNTTYVVSIGYRAGPCR